MNSCRHLVATGVLAGLVLGGGVRRAPAGPLSDRLRETVESDELAAIAEHIADEEARLETLATDYRSRALASLPALREQLDAGRARLEAVAHDVDAEARQALLDLHETFSADVRQATLEGLIADALAPLSLSADQLKALQPAVSRQLTRVAAVMDEQWKQGPEAILAIEDAVQGLRAEFDDDLRAVLSADQFQAFADYRAQVVDGFFAQLKSARATEAVATLQGFAANRDQLLAILEDDFERRKQVLTRGAADAAAQATAAVAAGLEDVQAETRRRLQGVLNAEGLERFDGMERAARARIQQALRPDTPPGIDQE